jgi:site-specific recombinase XerD
MLLLGREGEAVGVNFRPSCDSRRSYCDKYPYQATHVRLANLEKRNAAVSPRTPDFPDAAELAAFRACLGGMDARAAVAQFLPDRRSPGQSSRSMLGAVRRRLVALARTRHRDDLAAVLQAAPRSRKAKQAIVAIETLRAVPPPIPKVTDPIDRWLPARIATPLSDASVATLGDLVVRLASGGNWWRAVPGVGRAAGAAASEFVRSHREALKLRQVEAERSVRVIVPWEDLRAPRELDGSRGAFRAPRATCVLNADNDYEAVQAWLALHESIATQRAYRKEAERLMLWAIIERGKPLSSLTTEDAIAYRAFLRRPSPKERWIGPVVPRVNPAWRPFQGPLSARSTSYALQVIGALFRWLIEQRYVLANPFAGVKVRGAERAGPVDTQRAFSAHEWELICRVADFTAIEDAYSERALARLRFLLDFSYATGLRADELVRATLGDIEVDDQQARWLVVHGKGAKRGRVALPGLAWSALERYLRARGVTLRRDQWRPSAPLVARAADDEAPISTSRLWRIMKGFFARAADVLQESSPSTAQRARLASPHWMRHTHASHGLARGVDVAIMRDNLRHSSIAVTSTYLHADDVRRAKAIGGAFGRP